MTMFDSSILYNIIVSSEEPVFKNAKNCSFEHYLPSERSNTNEQGWSNIFFLYQKEVKGIHKFEYLDS